MRAERLAEAVRRILVTGRREGTGEQVPVERGEVTRFVPVDQIRYVEAEGDYARLHSADGSHPVRVHRSLLIATAFLEEVRVDMGRCTV